MTYVIFFLFDKNTKNTRTFLNKHIKYVKNMEKYHSEGIIYENWTQIETSQRNTLNPTQMR